MVSPISALTSRSAGVQAPARVAAVAPKTNEVEAASGSSGAAVAAQRPALDAGARDALPAGYRNLALPVEAAGADLPSEGARAGSSPLMAAYGPGEAALAALPRLVGNRPGVQAVLREAQAALKAQAEARGETPAEFLDAAPIIASAKLPSRNAPDAEATLRASLLARDGERDTAALDIYLAKTGPSSFEAVTYDRDFAAPAGGFPYAAAPLSQDRILFDPAAEAILAAAGWTAAETKRMAFGRAAVAGAIIAAALLVVLLFA